MRFLASGERKQCRRGKSRDGVRSRGGGRNVLSVAIPELHTAVATSGDDVGL